MGTGGFHSSCSLRKYLLHCQIRLFLLFTPRDFQSLSGGLESVQHPAEEFVTIGIQLR